MSFTCDLVKDRKPSSGHTVSHSNIKTKRRFLPNIQAVSLKSDVLGFVLKMNIAVRTLRTVVKHGGIDGYLVNAAAKDLTQLGLKLRRKIQKRSLVNQEKK